MLNRATLKNPLNKTMRLAAVPSAEDLRRTFDSALAQIQHVGKTAKASQTPIVVRRRTMAPVEPATEKRALTDAARALAQLWHISPTLVR
jgi:hypothetical protein